MKTTTSGLATATVHSRSKYVTAHPNSEMGDPNYADQIGYELVCYGQDGLMIYRRKANHKSGRLPADVVTWIMGIGVLILMSLEWLRWLWR